MSFLHLITYLLILACLSLSHVSGQLDKDKDVNENEPLTNTYHVGYRKVNWCVTGKDEPELHEWPFTQFAWYLRKAFHRKLDPLFRYDLRFFDIFTKQKHTGLDGRLYKTMHAMFKAEKRAKLTESYEENWEPMEIEGLIIQANSNPFALALPTGQFFEPGDHGEEVWQMQEVNCGDCPRLELWAKRIACRKRAKIHIEHPTIMAWHHLQSPSNVSHKMHEYDQSNLPPTVKKQSEVHANFRFFSPKCSAVRRMSFLILVVRSFVRHEYDLFMRGPYDVTVRDQEYLSDIHPSPYNQFYTSNAICHHPSASDLYLEHPQKYPDFEMNHFFDCCIREEENVKSDVTIEILRLKGTKSTSCFEKLYKEHSEKEKVDAEVIELGQEKWWCFYPFFPKCDLEVSEEEYFEHAIADYKACPPCLHPSSTTTVNSTSKPFKLIQRSSHGGLMIMTNFCLQPLVIYIARFYKETFNTKQRKGNKSWYWCHLLGGMVSSGLVYFGYFAGSSGDDISIEAHTYIGNIYIVTLALCYVTSWGRNKDTIVTTIAEFVHGCLGYVTIGLAVAGIATAPKMGFISKLFCYLMLATQGFFMIVMTCNICLLDRKIGMRPRRRHFPTVEARFDEIRVPGYKFRTIMLIIFATITFVLSISALFVA